MKPVRKKKAEGKKTSSSKKSSKSVKKKAKSVTLDQAIRMRSPIDTMREYPLKALKRKAAAKVLDPQVVSAFNAGHSLVLTKRDEETVEFLTEGVSSKVTPSTPTPLIIKKLMRNLTLECFQKIFFEVSGDLIAIARDRSLPPVARGIARLAIKFQKTGDIHILNALTQMMGLMNKDSDLEDSPERVRDFIVGAMLDYDRLRLQEDNTIDVGGAKDE